MSTVAKKMMMGSGAGDSAYKIDQSLIFEQASNSQLSRVVSSAGNRRTYTFSTWIKKTSQDDWQAVMSVDSHIAAGGNDNSGLHFYEDTIYIVDYDYSTTNWLLRTNRVFRDNSSWYHIVYVVDTTQGTAANRVKLYINGVQETSFSTATYPSQNVEGLWNSTITDRLGGALTTRVGNGSQIATTNGMDGNLAETHFIDGTALTPSSFGETNSDTNQWIPKEYSGSYGTNGFYLKFVSGALGTDSSGEGNNFTSANLANSDVVTDTPTNNFCTMNPLALKANHVSSQGNLKMTWADGNAGTDQGTMLMKSGKWYWEIVANVAAGVPLAVGDANFDFKDAENIAATTGGVNAIGYGPAGYIYQTGGSAISDPATFGTSDIAAIAVDVDGGTVKFYKNNSLEYTYTYGTSGVGITPNGNGLVPLVSGSQLTTTLNFGQNGTFSGVKTAQGNADGNGIGDFYYAPPSGYLALCTSNLPAPAISLPSAHFNTVLYTGNGSTQSISGVGHQPDWVWIKNRSAADDHKLTDAVRGVTNEIEASSGDAEATNADGLTAFDSDGFSLGDDDEYNTNTENYVSWNWKANGAGSNDTSGDIDATVSANATAGFSIVNYVPNGTASATIPHGLGVAPDMVFYKRYNGTSSWFCWTTAIDGSNDYLVLNGTDAAVAVSQAGGTSFTSSFIRATNYGASGSPEVVAYCFASKEGFSKIGAYTGNGNADGMFINTGFRPAWVMFKRANTTGYWGIHDVARHPSNTNDARLFTGEGGAAETSHGNYNIDFLSNGFKPRVNHTGMNTDASTYFYMAFAESPFKYANAR